MRLKHRVKHSPFSEWRYQIGCIASFSTFVLLLISYVTPFWLQSWPRIHTPFLRLGLWEFCMNGYVQRLDPEMITYFGCWWILSPYYKNIFNDLVPFWFLIIQVLMTLALCFELVIGVWLIIYLCERIRHIERRAFSISAMTFGHSVTAILLTISIVIFGANFQNPSWMPYPKLNWPSWSYGLAIFAALSSILSAISFGLMDREMRRDIQELVLEFPMSTKIRTRRRWKLRRNIWSDEVESKPRTIPVVPVGELQTTTKHDELTDSSFSASQRMNIERDPDFSDDWDDPSEMDQSHSGSRYPGQNLPTQTGMSNAEI